MRLVIFDCDGTLVDSQHNITSAMAHAFTAHGLPPPSTHEILGGVGLSLTEAFIRLAPQAAPDVRHSLADHYRNAFAGGMLSRGTEPLYPGITEIIEHLRGQDAMALGIATGKSKRGVARVLAEQGWQDAFATIQTADDHPSKPHPSMILTAMAETGATPATTIMIGDTTFDIEMALGARASAIGVSWGYHAPSTLHDAGAHTVVSDARDLAAAIDALLASPQQRT
ncbi:MAG: HAD-IA family hydrolase [Hyphomicrobiaceae bacterium]